MLRRFALVVLATFALAQAPNTKLSLVSDQSSVRPGTTVWVGVHLQLEPGWHTYWLNPGDSGEPPKVQWTLPTGFTAGPLEYPAPSRMKNPAGVDFGYHDEAIYLAKLKVPPTAKGPANITANVRWLACKDICVPQKGTATLTLKTGTAAPDPTGKPLIDASRARLPKALPYDWKTNVITNPREILLNFMPGVKIDSAEFFPFEPQLIDNAAPQKLSATSVRAQLALAKGPLAAQAKSLDGVLVLNGTDVYTVKLPIKK